MACSTQKLRRIKPRRFSRHSALVDRGWLRVLTRTELALWNAYENHADSDGVAMPDGKTLASLIGNSSKTHIGAIRDRLNTYRLLDVLDSGGGRGRRCRVRLLVPPSPPADLPPRKGGDFGAATPSREVLELAPGDSRTTKSVGPALRAAVIQRDGLVCRYCGKVVGENLRLDHLVPLAQSGPTSLENLAVSCFRCNRVKGGRTPEQAGMTLRPVPVPAAG